MSYQWPLSPFLHDPEEYFYLIFCKCKTFRNSGDIFKKRISLPSLFICKGFFKKQIIFWSIIALFLLYNKVNQLYIYTYIPHFGASLPPPSPHYTPLGHYRAPSRPLCVIHQLPTSYLTHDNVYISVLLSQFVPPSPCTGFF